LNISLSSNTFKYALPLSDLLFLYFIELSTFGAHFQAELNRTDSRSEPYCESKGWSSRPTGRPEQKPETTEKSGG